MRKANEFQKDVIKQMRSHASRVKELREKYVELSAQSRNTGLYGPDKIKQLKNDAAQAYSDMINAMDTAQRELQAACEAYALEVDNGEALNPADLTDDVKLLNCGVPLSEKDLQQMCGRNSDNRTMLRLIANYAEQHNIRCAVPASEEREAAKAMKSIASSVFNQKNYSTVEQVVNRVFGVDE